MPDSADALVTPPVALSVKVLITMAALVSALVGFGIAWGTATAATQSKVDAKDQLRVDATQDQRQATVAAEQNAKLLEMAAQLNYIVPRVERTDDRVSKMYCSSIPARLREGCQ